MLISELKLSKPQSGILMIDLNHIQPAQMLSVKSSSPLLIAVSLKLPGQHGLAVNRKTPGS